MDSECRRGNIMLRYPNISEHGLIGDLQTAALVTSDGTVDFFCCPRFDSPSVFASLLDADRGGYFSIKPAAEGYVTRLLYFPDTCKLISRLTRSPSGCSSRSIRSRQKSRRSTASWVFRRATTRSARRRRSACSATYRPHGTRETPVASTYPGRG